MSNDRFSLPMDARSWTKIWQRKAHKQEATQSHTPFCHIRPSSFPYRYIIGPLYGQHHNVSCIMANFLSHLNQYRLIIRVLVGMTYFGNGGHWKASEYLPLTLCPTLRTNVMSLPVDCVFQVGYHKS